MADGCAAPALDAARSAVGFRCRGAAAPSVGREGQESRRDCSGRLRWPVDALHCGDRPDNFGRREQGRKHRDRATPAGRRQAGPGRNGRRNQNRMFGRGVAKPAGRFPDGERPGLPVAPNATGRRCTDRKGNFGGKPLVPTAAIRGEAGKAARQGEASGKGSGRSGIGPAAEAGCSARRGTGGTRESRWAPCGGRAGNEREIRCRPRKRERGLR